MDIDVVIVGKGIAGLVLSFLLKRKGINHRLLDRRSGTDDFPLAETLPPSALPLLNQLDLLSLFETTAVQKTYGYHSIWGRNAVTDTNFYFHKPYQYGLKIDKQAVIRTLEKEQEACLVSFGKALAISPREDGVTVSFGRARRTFRAKLIIDATGRKRSVLNKLNTPSVDYDTLIAHSCHVPLTKHPALTHPVFIETFEEGWGIVSRLNDRENVFTLFTKKENRILPLVKQYKNWPSLLSQTTYLKDFLTEGPGIRVKGANANSSKAQSLSGKHWLAIGDAAVSFDPLSSHGITNALYSAHEAAKAIERYVKHDDRNGLKEYDESLSAIFAQYLQTKNRLYESEKRWEEGSFWKLTAAR